MASMIESPEKSKRLYMSERGEIKSGKPQKSYISQQAVAIG